MLIDDELKTELEHIAHAMATEWLACVHADIKMVSDFARLHRLALKIEQVKPNWVCCLEVPETGRVVYGSMGADLPKVITECYQFLTTHQFERTA